MRRRNHNKTRFCFFFRGNQAIEGRDMLSHPDGDHNNNNNNNVYLITGAIQGCCTNNM